MAKLTALQAEFLNKLFGSALGNVTVAANEVGVADPTMLMTDELVAEIKRKADQQIVLSSAKAVYTLQNILNNPDSVPFMDKLSKVAGDILDRAGLSKQDRNVQGAAQVGLVFLPSLKALPEPPHEEDTKTGADVPVEPAT